MRPFSLLLLAVAPAALLTACGGSARSQHPMDHSTVHDEIIAQDRRISDLETELRLQRARLDSTPGDTATLQKIDHILSEIDIAESVREDAKRSADEQAREDYDRQKQLLNLDEDPDRFPPKR
ncbi:MAG: hypothetical protein H6686_07905 [Fibrobacteria bacterium]|nr:hypothetical protein [Fibrobacteria bacterium]